MADAWFDQNSRLVRYQAFMDVEAALEYESNAFQQVQQEQDE